MKLNAPKTVTWIICLALVVLGILGKLAVLPFLAGFAFWLVAAGGVLLILATMLKGL